MEVNMKACTLGTIREFKTKNFTVRVTAEEDWDTDLSWDEDGSVRKGLESGEFIAFQVSATVYYRGREVGADYLGGCIYKSIEEFMDHKECGKQNREYAAKGDPGRCGSYFSGMVHEAIKQARKELTANRPYIRQGGI